MSHPSKISHQLLLVGLLCCSPFWGQAHAQPRDASGGGQAPPALQEPGAATPAGPQVDQELLDIAELFEEKGDFASALEIYDELRRDNPESLEVLDTSLGLCRKIPSCQPRLPKLINELEAFIKRHAQSTAARHLLLDYAQDLKDIKLAHRAILGLIKANPKLLANWLLLVEHHEDRYAYKALDPLLVSLTKRFPTSAEMWLRVADRALAKNDLKGAGAALKKTKPLLKPGDQILQTRWKALQREIDQIIEAIHHDYRQDTRWADLEDDFAHSTYP